MRHITLFLVFLVLLFSCKESHKQESIENTQKVSTENNIKYAKGFSINHYEDFTEIVVSSAWPDSKDIFRYVLINKDQKVPDHDENTIVIKTPIETLVAMSTTNIPTLEYLNVEDRLIGFPKTDYISSKRTRANIDSGKVKDLNSDLELNMELLLELNPELVIGFSVNGNNKTLDKIERFGIPVVLDGSWTEQHPLGRAEWIKFVGAFFDKSKEADSIFKTIETNYIGAKNMVASAKTSPTVISGSMFKDVWNVPGGKSFVAKYLDDANTNYIWKDTDKTGSLHLNFENVLEKAQHAKYWIGAGYFTSKSQMEEKYKGYTFFDAYKNDEVYTFTNKIGEKGGLLYFELGPLRPDLILKDIIKITHPELELDYEPYFFKRLK